MSVLRCRTRVGALLACAVAGLALATTARGQAGGRTVTVPLELMKTRHLAVQVRLNGQGPFRLVFDTGSPITFFSNAAATKAGLITPEVAARPALLGLRGQVAAKAVALGEAEVKDLPVMVLDHPTLAQIAAVDGPVDGIVGLSFFGRFRTGIDYQKLELRLTPGTYQPREVTAGLAARLLGPGATTPRVVGGGALLGLRVDKPDAAPGARVVEVLPGSAAAQAGVRVGDRLLTIDGRWTDSPAEAFEAASLLRPGRPAALVARRADETLRLEVTPRAGL
jgi:predicted aspartyl protease